MIYTCFSVAFYVCVPLLVLAVAGFIADYFIW